MGQTKGKICYTGKYNLANVGRYMYKLMQTRRHRGERHFYITMYYFYYDNMIKQMINQKQCQQLII